MKASLFRYPGSKAKLVDSLDPFLTELVRGATEFHDVFTGGMSVTLHMATKHPHLALHVNDLDPRMAAFYRVLTKPEATKALCGMIRDTTPTVEWFREVRETPPETEVELAYHAMFFNRCCFSGILDGNPIGGWNQTSEWTVGCRFNANRVSEEVGKVAAAIGGRLVPHEEDAISYIEARPDARVYIDPPYWVAGDQLYSVQMPKDKHARLASVLKNHANWVLSYDDAQPVRDLYAFARIEEISVRYSVAGEKKAQKKAQELVILPSLPNL